MARETRRQRRDQRKSVRCGEARRAARPRAQAPVRPGMQPASTQTGRREPRVARPLRQGVLGRAKKVEWPSRGQVIQGTIVVIIACAIVGTYLYGADQLFKPFVRNVLLGSRRVQ